MGGEPMNVSQLLHNSATHAAGLDSACPVCIWVTAILTNDEASTDLELRTHFIANGITPAKADEYLTLRDAHLRGTTPQNCSRCGFDHGAHGLISAICPDRQGFFSSGKANVPYPVLACCHICGKPNWTASKGWNHDTCASCVHRANGGTDENI
jgi:hypothetical protein